LKDSRFAFLGSPAPGTRLLKPSGAPAGASQIASKIWTALRLTDPGPFPVLLGIALIWIVFQTQSPYFLTPRNLSNLILQLGVTGILAIGVVLVMIAGEIDLSIGSVTGVCAGVLGVLLTFQHWPIAFALVAVLFLGLAIGFLQGLITVYVGVPSFLVTLGGLLTWAGLQLAVIGIEGEIPVASPFVRSIANNYLPPPIAWAMAAVAVGVAIVIEVKRARNWAAIGLKQPQPGWRIGLRLGLIGGGLFAVVGYLNYYLGVPYLLVLLLGITVVFGWVTRRTVVGRHLYAVGGNAEAARRAGVPVGAIRIAVLSASGMFAAIAGVVSASRLFTVSSGTGGGTLLLEAIAAAVIGGTSLFGGRGRVYNAILGALLIVSIENGLDLLGQSAATKDMATGIILVMAISVDAISRRRRASAAA
jgi:D-xylose transport system permease protein